jgi:hypothetical protein
MRQDAWSLTHPIKPVFPAVPGRRLSVAGIFSLLMIFLLVVPAISRAELEWKEKKQLQLKTSPLDVVQSEDGQWTFILSSGAVLVYAANEDRVTQTIPVDAGFDRLSFSGRNNSLTLTSSSRNLMKVIQLDVVHKIDVSGLAFMGAENAPVTIAVFSDYQ